MLRSRPLLVLVSWTLLLSGCLGQSAPTGGGPAGGHAGHGGPPPPAMDHGRTEAAAWTPFEFPASGLERAKPSQTVRLGPGDRFALEAGLVEGTLDGSPVALFAYNAQVPGPTLRVAQGADVTVEFSNRLPVPTTVHWHGVRVAPAMDGVVPMSQQEVPPNGTFRYELTFEDEGVFWYHPHVREDVQQERGLAGVIVVDAADGAYARQEVLVLDDVLVGAEGFAAQYQEGPDHALMGRFGNELWVNGAPSWTGEAAGGERVRFVLLNAASVRPFNVSFPGAAKVELIGLDAGFLPAPTAVSSVLLGPAERAVVDVVAPAAGAVQIAHVSPEREAVLGTLAVAGATDTAEAPLGPHERARASLAPLLALDVTEPDVTWDIDVEMMGMRHGMEAEDPRPIEWEGDGSMAAMSADQVRWILRDAASGKENAEILYAFEAGSTVAVRIRNLADSPHPMQHPIHLHGQRFVVRSVDGVENPWPAWKDTVQVPAGSEAVLVVDMSNPGTWLVHCHIPEHMESGMMASFTVG